MERECGSFRFLAARLTLAHMHVVEVSRDVLLWLRGGWNLSPESWSAVEFIFCFLCFFLFHTRLACRSAEDFSWKNNLWIFFYFVFLSQLFLLLHTISLLIFFLLAHKRKLARFEALIWCLKSTTSFAAISWLYARDHQIKNLKSHEWIALTMERQNESVDVDFELDPCLCADKRLRLFSSIAIDVHIR